LIGFENPAQWFLLEEDKCINALNKDVFPGNVLLKLGFGYSDKSLLSRQDWNNSFENSKNGSSYQVRVHVYQCKNIPASDSNGLADPFVEGILI
jgi:hypothetical protein